MAAETAWREEGKVISRKSMSPWWPNEDSFKSSRRYLRGPLKIASQFIAIYNLSLPFNCYFCIVISDKDADLKPNCRKDDRDRPPNRLFLFYEIYNPWTYREVTPIPKQHKCLTQGTYVKRRFNISVKAHEHMFPKQLTLTFGQIGRASCRERV